MSLATFLQKRHVWLTIISSTQLTFIRYKCTNVQRQTVQFYYSSFLFIVTVILQIRGVSNSLFIPLKVSTYVPTPI